MDLEKAYDTDHQSEHWAALQQNGIDISFIKKMQDIYWGAFYQGHYRLGHHQKLQRQSRCHQGSVLSSYIIRLLDNPLTGMGSRPLSVCSLPTTNKVGIQTWKVSGKPLTAKGFGLAEKNRVYGLPPWWSVSQKVITYLGNFIVITQE